MLKDIKNKNIAFLCDVDLPNYLNDPKRYDYLDGKHSATGYYYWILKNFGFRNVSLVMPDEDLNHYDAVVFHYDNGDCIDINSKYKTLQIVTDRPPLSGVDLYAACNLSTLKPILNIELIKYVGVGLKYFLTGQWTYIHYPMALNYAKCNPSWPPQIFHYTGRKSTLIDKIYSDPFVNHMKSKGVNLRFDFDNDHNSGDEDVYFCVRKKTNYYSTACKGNNVDTKLGQKTANRLYQAWKMGTPLIASGSSAMAAVYNNEYDFLVADTVEQFEYQSLRLLDDRKLFENMISNCNKRKDEHTNSQIVKQFIDAFQILFK
jgi:hypothetical protein